LRETGESFVPASRVRDIPTGDTQLGFPSIRRSTEHVGTRPQGNLYRLDFFAVFVRNFHRNRAGFWLVRLFLPGTTCDARKKNRGIRNGSCGIMEHVTDRLDPRHLAPIDAPFTSPSVEATLPVTRLRTPSSVQSASSKRWRAFALLLSGGENSSENKHPAKQR
jgi:hypothetical protein